ncbi:hypothetical protein [Brevundimonas sp. CEF1]|uniref:hypothetical protein n=1 Tax=Brevundimonas sp. CEF1 TaxID=3442642 RepID=UPI003F50DBD3
MPTQPPTERQNQPPAPPPMQVIRGNLIYDPRNPPVRKIMMQKAGEVAVWSLIFAGFAVSAVLVGVGLFLGARLT